MTIQWIGPEDGEAVRRLWQDCFHDPESYADFYFQTVARRNRISGIKKDGRLVSMIHLNPYVLSADKRRFDSTYIVGVATDEAYRHQGCMRRLLYGTFDCLYREKQPFAYLMPADRKIYEPFGFRYIYRQFFARAAKREPTGHYMRAAGDAALRALPAGMADAGRLARWANARLEDQMDVFTWRDERYYEELLKETASDGGEVLLFYERETLVGTAAYIAEETYEVREVLARPGYEVRIAEWLADHLGEREGILLMPPCSIRDAGIKTGYRPMIMGRIIHLESFLMLLRYEGDEGTVCLDVSDPVIGKNNGYFRIDVERKRARSVKRLEKPEAGCRAVSVETLLEAAFGQGGAVDGIRPFEHIFINEIV